MCGGGFSSPEIVRSANFYIHRRLAHNSPIKVESAAGHLPCAHAHHISQSECDFSGLGAELSLHASASLAGARSL